MQSTKKRKQRRNVRQRNVVEKRNEFVQRNVLAEQYEKKLRKKRMKALFFNKKNLQIDFSTSDLIGDNYERVLCILKETGFNKYKAFQ